MQTFFKHAGILYFDFDYLRSGFPKNDKLICCCLKKMYTAIVRPKINFHIYLY